jgi:hypothetical protein
MCILPLRLSSTQNNTLFVFVRLAQQAQGVPTVIETEFNLGCVLRIDSEARARPIPSCAKKIGPSRKKVFRWMQE